MQVDLPILKVYTAIQRDRIVREFLSGNGHPLCSLCGEDVHLGFQYGESASVRLDARCGGCGEGFSWVPPAAGGNWDSLHLAYFEERRAAGVDLRCPVDDCRVVIVEYGDGVVVYRCPFCARTGSPGPFA
jgi:hypothetical protein